MTAAVVALFLSGAEVVRNAVSDPLVAAAWEQPSVLEEQRVGSLAGHLARGGVWVVGDYLDASGIDDESVDVESAAEYFEVTTRAASIDDHRAIRDRGAAIAAAGADDVAAELTQRLALLHGSLSGADVGLVLGVAGGLRIRLEEYLLTRIVEQVVHLDDLARSVGRAPWPYPTDGAAQALSVGWSIAHRNVAPTALLRALYRHGFAADAFPVL